MEYPKCGNFNSKNDSRLYLGASAILKSVDFTAFAVNVKTIAPTQKLYQSGHAIWWYTAPTIIKTFLEVYDFTGKTIILFATSGGSDLGRSASDLKVSTPSAAIRDGKLLNGRQTRESLAAWVNSLPL